VSDTTIGNILKEHRTVVFPGIYDALSAKLAEQVGFHFAFISGYSVAASLLGEPDMGLLTQMEMVDRARQICRCVKMPIIVDADTGYGNPLNVIRTINELIDAGAKGCFLEDQVWPKKCGHMRGKKVIPRAEYIEKIRAAVETRGNRDFYIVARTDALAADSLDEALARMEEARAAGADASFVEAPESKEQLATVGRTAPKPIVANMIEHGRTPVMPREELEALGFSLLIYPLSGIFAAVHALEAIYKTLHTNQTTLGHEAELTTFEKFNELIGVDEKYALIDRYNAG